MELFRTAKAVKLRSHHDKYMVADDDLITVRQSRNGSSRKAIWFVELFDSQVIHLKSCHGTYLTASETALLLGMTGKKVIQTGRTSAHAKSEPAIEWVPKRDGFQVKMMTRGDTCLRANGGVPPWRNSITHDVPVTSGTKNWVLWDVEVVDIPTTGDLENYLATMASFSSADVASTAPDSPMSVISSISSQFSSKQRGMEFFRNAQTVRLRSHHGKYLIAGEDEESVAQHKNGFSKAARWTVEYSTTSPNIIHLKSCYNKYLTASNQLFLLGVTGRKVLQTQIQQVDSSVEWEPIKDSTHVKLKTRYGRFLRANHGFPPYRNSVTHDIPHRTATQNWIMWDVDIVEILTQSPVENSPAAVAHSDSFSSDLSSPTSSISIKSTPFSRRESVDSPAKMPGKAKVEGRIVQYWIIDEDGEVDESMEPDSFTFKGNGVNDLKRKLEEETGLKDFIVCTRSPLNQKLYPLRLQLPPNNANMSVIIVPSSSRVAKDFVK